MTWRTRWLLRGECGWEGVVRWRRHRWWWRWGSARFGRSVERSHMRIVEFWALVDGFSWLSGGCVWFLILYFSTTIFLRSSGILSFENNDTTEVELLLVELGQLYDVVLAFFLSPSWKTIEWVNNNMTWLGFFLFSYFTYTFIYWGALDKISMVQNLDTPLQFYHLCWWSVSLGELNCIFWRKKTHENSTLADH